MRSIRFDDSARRELIDAVDWYERRQYGLGMRFLAELRACVEHVEAAPSSFPRLLEPRREPPVRRAILHRFPHALVFIATETEIRVLAIAHMKRRPGYWLSRVRRDA